MTEQYSNLKLSDLLSSSTTPEQYEVVIKDLLKVQEDIAPQEMSEGILMLSVFAPEPATFDKAAITGMTFFGDAKLETFITEARRLGVLVDAPEGRFMVKADVSEVLQAILSQYPEE